MAVHGLWTTGTAYDARWPPPTGSSGWPVRHTQGAVTAEHGLTCGNGSCPQYPPHLL